MSETMVERVAKAIARIIPVDGSRWCDGHGENFPQEYSAAEQRLVRAVARAAIEAMREPDDAMRLASKRYKRTAKVYSGPECYRQMIDAASGAK